MATQFKVGDRVKPRGGKSAYEERRRGTVVEVTPTRVRVMWDKDDATLTKAKRTWFAAERLMLVISCVAEQPAYGPGGWVLDTNE